MIHAICDFCGKDCDRTATLLTLQPFQNFARYHTDNKPFGTEDKARSFVICSECGKKHGLPNPYETYSVKTGEILFLYELDNSGKLVVIAAAEERRAKK